MRMKKLMNISPESRKDYLGFVPQNENMYNLLLDDRYRADYNSLALLKEIKENLEKSIICNLWHRNEAPLWCLKLQRYIEVYDLCFSKDDHVAFIKVLYYALTNFRQELYFVQILIDTLILLLRKLKLLSPTKDLTLPWRSLYNLCNDLFFTKNIYIQDKHLASSLKVEAHKLAHLVNNYFPLSSTQEIIDLIFPQLCPFDKGGMKLALEKLEWFLPTYETTYDKWFPVLMDIWDACANEAGWEDTLMTLMARLAKNHIGLIDWKPYCAVIYSRIIRTMDIPVRYSKTVKKKQYHLSLEVCAVWIVSSLDNEEFSHIMFKRFLSLLESYCHPSNFGKWSKWIYEMISWLSKSIINRLCDERYKRLPWQKQIPACKKIKDEYLISYVKGILNIVMIANSTQWENPFLNYTLYNLAVLKPDIVIPQVLTLLQKSLVHSTEPNMFLCALDCLIAIAEPLAEGAVNGYPEGPTHVFEILFLCLSEIDPNALVKTYKCLICIEEIIFMMPLVLAEEISENEELNLFEEKTMLEYKKLDEFILLLLEKYLLFLSSLQFSQNSNPETVFNIFHSDKWDNFSDLIHSLVPRMSRGMFLKFLSKIDVFIFSVILNYTSGRVVAIICGIMAKTYPEEVLNCFMPKLVRMIQSMVTVSGEIADESLEEELVYYLMIFSEITSGGSTVLTKYAGDITVILDIGFNVNLRKIVELSAEILKNVFISLTDLCIRNCFYLYEKNVCPIKDFGMLRKVIDLVVDWNVPTDDSIKTVHLLIEKYIIPSVEYIEKLLDGAVKLEREQLTKRLKIIEASLETRGLLSLCGKPLKDVNVNSGTTHFYNGFDELVTMPKGINGSLYNYVFCTISKLQDYIFSFAEDDTQSLHLVVKIWALFFITPDSAIVNEEFSLLKKFRNDPLRKKYLGKHIVYHVKKLKHLQAVRSYNSNFVITETHVNILENLVRLCVCKYRMIRVQAQCVIYQIFERISSLPLLIVPIISRLLKKNDVINSSTYKGVIMMLFGPYKPIINELHLDLYLEIFPLLVNLTTDDKQASIILLEKVEKIIHGSFPKLILISKNQQDPCEVEDLLSNSLLRLQMSRDDPFLSSMNEVKLSREKMILSQYNHLINELAKCLLQKNLHWRQQKLGLVFVYALGIRNVNYPNFLMTYIINNLLHDNLHIRHEVLKLFKLILLQHKVNCEKMSVTLCQLFGKDTQDVGFGERPENSICKFNLSFDITSEEDWNKHFFVDASVGYAPWPKLVEMFSHLEPPAIEDFNQNVFIHINVFFQNRENVKKLMQHLTIEDSIYLKSFNRNIAKTFKMLFHNCGSEFIENFRLELYELANYTQERNQILVMEVVAGIIKGSKHWSLINQQSIWGWLNELLSLVLKQLPSEKLDDWKTFLYYITSKKHPKRLFWLYKVLYNDLRNNVDTSLIFSRKLYSMECLMWQHQWQVEDINKDLFPVLLNLCSCDYELIRERVAGLMVQICMPDIGYKSVRDTYSPRVKHFVMDSISKLETGFRSIRSQSLNTNDTKYFEAGMHRNVETTLQPTSDFDYKSAKNLLKTITMWMKDGCFNFIGIKPEIYSFLPLLIMMENDNDLEVSYMCKTAITHLAEILILPYHIPFVLEAIVKASNNELWRAKISLLQFIEVISLHNIATFGSNEEWSQALLRIILTFLEDEKYEVRQKAGEALSGFIYCEIASDKTNLLIQFEQMLNEECTVKKHAGIIGLCAFLNASPYYYNQLLSKVFKLLSEHSRDTSAVTNTIKMTIREFIRTHYIEWSDIKQLLQNEGVDIEELIIPPDHYI